MGLQEPHLPGIGVGLGQNEDAGFEVTQWDVGDAHEQGIDAPADWIGAELSRVGDEMEVLPC